MVAHPRTSMGTHGLRPLGLPREIVVVVNQMGLPSAILRGSTVLGIAQVEELWRVSEAWWRIDALARTYVRLLLDSGRLLTLFHDDQCVPDDGWYEQRY